jgi:hypothetical protein
MNRDTIGDAKESVKPLAISLLRKRRIINSVSVLPLFTSGELGGALLDTYASILGISVEDVVPRREFTRKPSLRDAYFDEFEQHSIGSICAFADPSTGIRPHLKDDRRDENYLTYDEIHRLLRVHHERVMIVYDESYSYCEVGAKKLAMTTRLNDLRERGVLAFGYFGGSAHLLFCANELGRPRWSAAKDVFVSVFAGCRDRIIG